MIASAIGKRMKFIALLALIGSSLIFVAKTTYRPTSRGNVLHPEQNNKNDNHHRSLQLDPKSVTVKMHMYDQNLLLNQQQQQQHPQEDTLFMIINTPKCGTGGLTNSLVRSFNCQNIQNPTTSGPSPPSLLLGYHYECPQHHIRILRTHNLKDVYSTLQHIGPMYSKCTLLTAVRDPLTWIPSWFMEKHKQVFCWNNDGTNTNVVVNNGDMSETTMMLQKRAMDSPQDMVEYYRSWVHDNSKHLKSALHHLLPHLLQEFGDGHTLKQEWNTLSQQGYSWVSSSPFDNNNQSWSSSNSGQQQEEYPKCQLLFLKMEDSSQWPSILQGEIPGIIYERNGSREEDCPALVDHYHAIKNYQYTQDEKNAIIGQHDYLKDLFELYGH